VAEVVSVYDRLLAAGSVALQANSLVPRVVHNAG
jgi:hypothetical protein